MCVRVCMCVCVIYFILTWGYCNVLQIHQSEGTFTSFQTINDLSQSSDSPPIFWRLCDSFKIKFDGVVQILDLFVTGFDLNFRVFHWNSDRLLWGFEALWRSSWIYSVKRPVTRKFSGEWLVGRAFSGEWPRQNSDRERVMVWWSVCVNEWMSFNIHL